MTPPSGAGQRVVSVLGAGSPSETACQILNTCTQRRIPIIYCLCDDPSPRPAMQYSRHCKSHFLLCENNSGIRFVPLVDARRCAGLCGYNANRTCHNRAFISSYALTAVGFRIGCFKFFPSHTVYRMSADEGKVLNPFWLPHATPCPTSGFRRP